MKVKFYGVRGSYPVPGRETVKYGGNTSCVSFTNETDGKIERLIVDSGTGIIKLGKKIVNNYFEKKESLNIIILFTHLHPDHIQGFSFFAPNYFKECILKMIGFIALKKHVGMIIEQTMLPPTFPIEYKDLKSKRTHFELRDGSEFKLKTMQVNVMQAFSPSHPQQGALYYKITDMKTGKSAACIWDNESKIGGDKAVAKFSRDCNIMIHDTQYTTDEYENDNLIVQGFGHSTYEMALQNASLANIKDKLICTHFNPSHADDKLDIIQHAFSKKDTDFEIILAQEGMEIEI